MKIFTLAPAILPILSNKTPSQLLSKKQFLLEKASSLGIACETGSFGSISEDFNLYTANTDAGTNYKNYYIYKFLIPISQIILNSNKFQTKSFIDLIEEVEIRVFDEMIVVANMHIKINMQNAAQQLTGNQNDFDAYFVKWANDIFQYSLDKINFCFASCQSNSAFKKNDIDLMKPEHLDQPKIAWVHKIFNLTTEQLEGRTSKEECIENFILEQSLSQLLSSNEYYGWGDSVKIISNENDWETGCILAQYFYFSLDRFNRRLPHLIKYLRTSVKSRKLSNINSLGMNLRHRVLEKELQYADFLHGVAGDCRKPVEDYDKNWRFDELRKNLTNKLPILQDVLNELNDRMQRRANIAVESMLFFVSLLSLIGLFINSHDYAAKPAKDKISSLNVIEAMYPINPSDILSFSVAISCFCFLAFITIRFSLINKILKRISILIS